LRVWREGLQGDRGGLFIEIGTHLQHCIGQRPYTTDLGAVVLGDVVPTQAALRLCRGSRRGVFWHDLVQGDLQKGRTSVEELIC